MSHNLFHSLPCIHSLDPNFFTLQIWPAPQHMWNHHSLNFLCLLDMSLNKYTFLPPFYDTWFFWHHRFNAYTFLVTKVHLVGVSQLIPFSLSCQCQSICYRFSLSFFCIPYIFTYQPIIDIYGFTFPSPLFFLIFKNPLPLLHFFDPSHSRILFLFFNVWINVPPSFFLAPWIVSSHLFY